MDAPAYYDLGFEFLQPCHLQGKVSAAQRVLSIRRRQTLKDLYRITVRILDKDVAPDAPPAWLRDLLDRFLLDRTQSRVELLRVDHKAEVHRFPT